MERFLSQRNSLDIHDTEQHSLTHTYYTAHIQCTDIVTSDMKLMSQAMSPFSENNTHFTPSTKRTGNPLEFLDANIFKSGESVFQTSR